MIKLISSDDVGNLEVDINNWIIDNPVYDSIKITTTPIQYTVGNVSGHGLNTKLFHLAVINY